MHRILPMLILLAGLLFSASPARAERICEDLGCFTAECWMVGPGHRRCRRVCRRHCYWREEPRYVAPQPQYEEPRYVAPHHSDSSPTYSSPRPFPAEAVGALLLVLGAVGLIALFAQGISTDWARAQTAAIEKDTLATRDLTNRADATAHDIDAFVDHAAREHYERGRAAADEEWTRE